MIVNTGTHLKYELVMNLKHIEIINIRQSSFYQIRVTVMQQSK